MLMKTKIFAICLTGMAIALGAYSEPNQTPVSQPNETICIDSIMTPMTAADILLSVIDKGYIKNGKYYSVRKGKTPSPDGLYSVIETTFDGTIESIDTIKLYFKK